MLPTYEAILNGDQLQWLGEKPPHTDSVSVYVTILGHEPDGAERGQQMADALGRLADAGGLSAIEDPVRWQRDQRHERPLPGRDAARQ